MGSLFNRHLRYLLKWAEELAAKQPSLAELQNRATTSTAVTDAIRAELTVVSNNQDLDHARTQEERDGRLNERYVLKHFLSNLTFIFMAVCPLMAVLILSLTFFVIFRAEKTFILTGVDLPSPASDPLERQRQLKLTVSTVLAKLDPALSVHAINYVRVVKSPKPSILEVECGSAER
jgi:hypothetical protein